MSLNGALQIGRSALVASQAAMQGAGNNMARRVASVLSGPPSVGQWTDTSLTGSFEPGILNPDESLTIDGKALLIEPGTATITVGTPNGITDSIELAGMAPCV